MLWGLAGVIAIFADAIVQLGQRGLTVLRAGLGPGEWLACALITALFLYGEGMRALERRWVPHMIERVHALGDERAILLRLLAPLYALSLIGAPARVLARAWAGVIGIVLAVLIVRALPEPWRGITDFAVAIALTWGLGAILFQAPRALRPRSADS
jgi:hypothetical protein